MKYERFEKSVSEHKEKVEANAERNLEFIDSKSRLDQVSAIVRELGERDIETHIEDAEQVYIEESASIEEERVAIEEERDNLRKEIADDMDALEKTIEKLTGLEASSKYGKQFTITRLKCDDIDHRLYALLIELNYGDDCETRSGLANASQQFNSLHAELQATFSELKEFPIRNNDYSELSKRDSEQRSQRSRDNSIVGSKVYTAIVDSLDGSNVDYVPIEEYHGNRTQEDIIQRLSGGDQTEGSCSSLAFAYAGNKGGYNVLDFRDGESRAFFSQRSSIDKVASLPGVQSTIYSGKDDMVTANQLLDLMVEGKEYYLATGQHASIVRRTNSGLEYLELQHPSTGNGWHNLNNDILMTRFGCRSNHLMTYTSYLIDVDTLVYNREFLDVLGYINTASHAQRKGGSGNVR